MAMMAATIKNSVFNQQARAASLKMDLGPRRRSSFTRLPHPENHSSSILEAQIGKLQFGAGSSILELLMFLL